LADDFSVVGVKEEVKVARAFRFEVADGDSDFSVSCGRASDRESEKKKSDGSGRCLKQGI